MASALANTSTMHLPPEVTYSFVNVPHNPGRATTNVAAAALASHAKRSMPDNRTSFYKQIIEKQRIDSKAREDSHRKEAASMLQIIDQVSSLASSVLHRTITSADLSDNVACIKIMTEMREKFGQTTEAHRLIEEDLKQVWGDLTITRYQYKSSDNLQITKDRLQKIEQKLWTIYGTLHTVNDPSVERRYEQLRLNYERLLLRVNVATRVIATARISEDLEQLSRSFAAARYEYINNRVELQITKDRLQEIGGKLLTTYEALHTVIDPLILNRYEVARLSYEEFLLTVNGATRAIATAPSSQS